MWGRSVVMLLVLLAFLGLAVEWLFGRHALRPLDVRAAPSRTADPPAPSDPAMLVLRHETLEAPPERPSAAREEVARAAPPTMSPSQIEQAIRDLHDDDIRRNAGRALHKLLEEPAAQPQLRQALGSRDLQQRHMAALILRLQDAAPDAALIEVSLEALDPEVLRTIGRVVPGSVRRSVLPYLYRHPESCVLQCRAMLWNDRPRERLLGAFLLACARDTQHLETVVQILTSHLQDNQIGGDALLATHGLYRLGEAGRAMIQGLRRHADPQAHGLLTLVLEDLDHPPTTREEYVRRSSFHDATCIYHDPAVEYVVGRMSVMGL